MGTPDQPVEVLDEQVVIVGAGPSGLALAIELGLRNVKCLVVERNDRVGHAPRAKTTNVRTRTHLRRWGIADRLAEESPFGVEYPSTISFVTKLGGRLLARIENASNCSPARHPDYPEHGQWVPQYRLEQVLRRKAESLEPVKLVFGTDFIDAQQDAGTVQVTILERRSGVERTLLSRFLVGADGARSAVRDLVGAKMEGTYGLSRNYNIVFRAPGLAQAHGHGPGTMYWQVDPAAPSLIGPMDQEDIWFFMPTRLPDGFEITQETAADLIRQATGIDLPYEILSSDEWVASSLLADRYRSGRAFLIGDACHLHPPFGGYGMNMGVSDGVDLGWKIGAVCDGWGGPHLLDSYEAERRPVHEKVMAEAATNHAVLSNDFWDDDLAVDGPVGDQARSLIGERILATKRREFHTLGTVLGQCYEGSEVVQPDGSPQAPHDSVDYVPSSRPGCLAPHVWREDGRSLYDCFGTGYTLLCRFDAAPSAIGDAKRQAEGARVPLAIIYLTENEARGRYTTRLTLVRPDQHIAWRGDRLPEGLMRKVAGWPASAGYSADGALIRALEVSSKEIAG